ncbi:MAG TPA: type IV toxin-antitoxin system AbiEi family antitoxin [Polyangiaceae bacterium]|nr:type IV toxin-antitoxin system AbiEi family antitoxin [Polyangiaceae bacterium]
MNTLRALGQSVTARLISKGGSSTLQLELGAHVARLSFEVRTTRTHLSYPLAAGIIEEAKHTEVPWLLFAPYVPGPIGQHLVSQQVSYVDSVGNCHVETREMLVAHIEGRKPVREPGVRMPGVTSHQLLFALLAQPDLAEAPVRRIALAAGIGRSAAQEQLGRLNMQGLLDYYAPSGLLQGRELLDRWLTAYAESVRPSWLIARCRPQVSDPQALEALIEGVCGNGIWAFGGAAAASRMLRFERGTETVLHLPEIPRDLLERLQVVPAADGPLTLLRTPGALAYRGAMPHLAHPLLVYSELLTSTEPQAARAANALREQFLAKVA